MSINQESGNKGQKRSSQGAKRVEIVSVKLCRESSMLYDQRQINTPGDAAQLIQGFLADSDREMIVAVCLDTKHQPTALTKVSVGTLNSSLVHPREVFKVAILSNAAAVILAHNHPSGIATPSEDDINITKRIVEAGTLMGIDALDHIIIGGIDNYKSMRELGLI